MEGRYQAKYPVQTVEKALDILLYLKENASGNGLSLNQISDGTGMGKSSVPRFLDTLLEYDFVEKSADGLAYKLGWGAFSLGCNIPKNNGLDQEKIASALKDLSNQFGEIVNLGIRNQYHMIIIQRFFPDYTPSSQRLVANVTIGEREPLSCTGIGKLFLSEMKDSEVLAAFRSTPPVQTTATSIVTEEALLDEITQVRKQGYALDRGEAAPDVFCIATPLKDYTGRTVAGISISIPTGRMEEEKLIPMVEQMKEAAYGISKRLGYPG